MTLLPLLVLMIAAVGAVEQNNVEQSIEVRVIVDNFAIQNFKAHVPTNTDAAIQDFIKAVLVDVNSIYAELSSSNIKLDVRLVGIELIKDEVISPETSTGSGKVVTDTILDQFKAWAMGKTYSPAVDHTMLLTGLDLVDNNGGSSVSGVAYENGMCSNDQAFSVSEFKGSGTTAITIAHEMAHTLGAKHDSNGNSCDQSAYVMAEVGDIGAGKASAYRFSTCSINYMVSNTHPCLKSTTAAAMTSTTTPGELYTPDQICQMAVGKSSIFCRELYDGINTTYSSMCGVMWCKNPNGQCGSVRPPSGFVCGAGKRCKIGECLASSTAPTNFDDKCPFGDTPGPMNSKGETCQQLVGSFNGNCYEDVNRFGCCASCDMVRQTGLKGCEYGDKAAWCSTEMSYPIDCYDNGETCCGSCKKYETGISGCEYGDQETWCSTDMSYPYDCYYDDASCCGSCKQYETGISGCKYGDHDPSCTGTQEDVCFDDNNRSACCKLCNGYSG